MSDFHFLIHASHELHKVIDENMKENLGDKITKTIKTHAAIGSGAGLIPIPAVDVVAIVANTWTMYVRINNEIGMPFSGNIMKSIATGIATNLISIIPGVLLAKIGASALKLIPGFGSVGGMAIDAATNYALMLIMGVVYVKALTILYAKKQPITEENLKQAAKEAGKDREFIKKAFTEAKEQYKNKAKEQPITEEI